MNHPSLVKRGCQTCDQQSQYFCHGCQMRFCLEHADEHRQSLYEQLDWFTVDHDEFLQQLNHASVIPDVDDPLKLIIDRWEREMIRDIRKKASEARQALTEARRMHFNDLKEKLSLITTKLHQAYEEKQAFDERQIQQWSKKLRQLEQDFRAFSTFTVRIHGNTPVVMPVVKIQPDLFDERDDERTIGIVPITRLARSSQCFCNTICLNGHVSIVKEDRFHISTDHAKIWDDGQVIIHDNSNDDASVRGLQEYSTGEQKIYFRLERFSTSRPWLFIGIISKQAPFDQHAYQLPSVYGWVGTKEVYRNGKCVRNRQDLMMEMKEEDMMELTLDCDRRTVILRHLSDAFREKLIVDTHCCPYPWQIVVCLRNAHDTLRILPSSIGSNFVQISKKARSNTIKHDDDDV